MLRKWNAILNDFKWEKIINKVWSETEREKERKIEREKEREREINAREH